MNSTLLFTLVLKSYNVDDFSATVSKVRESYMHDSVTAIFLDNKTRLLPELSASLKELATSGTVFVYNVDLAISPDFKLCFPKPKNTVLYLDDQRLEDHLVQLRENTLWNARSRVLVLARNNVREWLDKLWKHTRAATSVVVLSPPSFFTWLPYHQEECSDVITITKLAFSSLFSPRITSGDLNNCPLKVETRMIFPLVLQNFEDGVEINVIRSFSKKHNLNLQFVPEEEFFWATIKGNGRPGGALKMIYENRVDVAFAGVTRLWEYSRFSDMSSSYFEDYLSWYVPVPNFIPNIEKLQRSLPPNDWYLIIIAFMLLTGSSILVTVMKKSGAVTDCVLNCVRAFLNSSCNMPSFRLLIFLYMILYFSSLHITTVYQSALIYMLSNQVLEKPISRIDQALDQNLEFHFYDIHRSLVVNSESYLLQQIFKRNLTYFSRVPEYHLFLPQKKGLFLGPRAPTLFYLKRGGWVDNHGRIMGSALREPFMANHNIMLTPPGHPLTLLLDFTIRQLVEGGFPQWWVAKFAEHSVDRFSRKNVPLSADGLVAAFMLLGIFLAISVWLFFFEIFWIFFMKNCKRMQFLRFRLRLSTMS